VPRSWLSAVSVTNRRYRNVDFLSHNWIYETNDC